MSLKAAIIADDLTGACDASLPFALGGCSVHVGIAHAPTDSCAEIVGLSTESRDASPRSGARRVKRLVEQALLGDPILLFKKVDSLLRGAVGAEIQICREVASAPYSILCPALPRFARAVVDGVVIDARGHSISIAESLNTFARLPLAIIPASSSPEEIATRIEAAVAGGAEIVVCDAETRVHLAAIAHAIITAPPAPIVAGASDLACAFARELDCVGNSGSSPSWVPVTRVLFVLGSLNESLRRQFLRLSIERAIPSMSLTDTAAPPGAISFVLESISSDAKGTDRGAVAERLSRAVKEICGAQHFDVVACIGGAVAAKVCTALNITSLTPKGELTPGFVLSQAHSVSPVPLMAMRSGGFGSDTDLVDAYDRLMSGMP